MAAEKPATKEERLEEAAEPAAAIRYRGWKAMPYAIGRDAVEEPPSLSVSHRRRPERRRRRIIYRSTESLHGAGNEAFEKLGTIGTSSNLLVYLTTVFHVQSVTAAATLNIFDGTANLAPVFGAFLSDTYLGRYLTLGFASISSLMGMLTLTLTAAITKLHPPQCDKGQQCAGPSPTQLAVLFLSFLLLVVGAGGIRPCNLAFGADQFNPHTDSGRKGINSFFNWYYFTFTFAMMLSSTIVIYVQTDISWALGLAIPTAFMFFSCAFFFVGTRIYVRVKPEGSPFTSIAQVLVAAFKKRALRRPDEPRQSLFNPLHKNCVSSKLPYTDQFGFLDKAAIMTSTDEIKDNNSASNPWRQTTRQQVEEVKCLLRIIPIWSAGILFYVAVLQNSSYVVFQALQSDRNLGKTSFQIPAGSFSVFSMLALTVWIPLYDRVIVPRLQRITGNEGGITLLQRMGVGIVISIVAMVVSAMVEKRRRSLADSSSGGAISSMSSLWLIPQITLLGLSEAFNLIGQVEFYYKQFPENMRSIAGSLVFLSSAVANYLSGFMITVIHRTTGDSTSNWLDGDLNKGKLDYFYFLIAVVGVLNLMYFIICARWYRYKGSESEPEISLEENKSNSSLV